tara:strand:+ start:6741 stop:6968 length:228 start_codon:yes stop_codon:yes gene_type:complete
MDYTVKDIDKILQFKTWTDKQKVDELLRIDAVQYCNLGTDSTTQERKQVNANSLSIYKEIKKIDPELGAILMYDK